MNKIQLTEINIVKNIGTWNTPKASTPEKLIGIESKYEPDIIHLCNTIQQNELKNGDKVYFSSFSKFPRYKFREAFIKNPIVRSAEKADAIVLDKRRLADINTWERTYFKIVNTNNYIQVHDASSLKLPYDSNVKISLMDGTINTLKANDIIAISEGKKLIYDDTLLNNINKDCVELTEKMIENIAYLLNSGSQEDIKMGVNICTTLDYEKYGCIVAYLLSQSKQRYGGWYGININSMAQIYIKKLEEEFNYKRDGSELNTLKKMMNTEIGKRFARTLLQTYIDKYIGAGHFNIQEINK